MPCYRSADNWTGFALSFVYWYVVAGSLFSAAQISPSVTLVFNLLVLRTDSGHDVYWCNVMQLDVCQGTWWRVIEAVSRWVPLVLACVSLSLDGTVHLFVSALCKAACHCHTVATHLVPQSWHMFSIYMYGHLPWYKRFPVSQLVALRIYSGGVFLFIVRVPVLWHVGRFVLSILYIKMDYK